ncbi:MAG: DNA alkylation repair protein [Chloroflexota bacterium]|nr:DNA alkylation repair protein [Chloroflexota bacterium]
MTDRALKNMFNQQSVAELAVAIQKAYPAFDSKAFSARVFDDDWQGRELKERMRHITTVLGDFLPPDYRTALGVLQRALPFLAEQSFEKMVFPDYVEVYGLDDWEASISALEEFTQHVSAEFAVRPFVARYPERTMAQMLEWAQHEHPGVRRLASEGCRPRLPWGIALQALKADPSPILPILEQLKHDEEESVRRSVANNLNDISKDNPDVVIEVLQRWQADGTAEIQWITGHALRTLVKKGHSEALELLGYPSDPAIAVRNPTVEPEIVPMGGKVTVSFEIESLSDQPQDLMIDYVVYLMRANGKQTPKVFKLTKKTLQPGEVLPITKNHSFAPVTTRKYYPGEHAIEPKINGKLLGRVEFVLQ